jgi:hypothetical protein
LLFLLPCLDASQQASAEDPFDGEGMDDILLELNREFAELLSIKNTITLPEMEDDGHCFAGVKRR